MERWAKEGDVIPQPLWNQRPPQCKETTRHDFWLALSGSSLLGLGVSKEAQNKGKGPSPAWCLNMGILRSVSPSAPALLEGINLDEDEGKSKIIYCLITAGPIFE